MQTVRTVVDSYPRDLERPGHPTDVVAALEHDDPKSSQRCPPGGCQTRRSRPQDDHVGRTVRHLAAQRILAPLDGHPMATPMQGDYLIEGGPGKRIFDTGR